MSERPARPPPPRRHPWPRALVRLRRADRDVVEVASFAGAALAAVGRFLTGRWSEPAGKDYLAPKDAGRRALGRRLTSRKASAAPRALAAKVSNGDPR
jgi:hypothetical protein